jgi:hypothetical protein
MSLTHRSVKANIINPAKYEVRTQCLGSRNRSWEGITGESGHVFYLDISMHSVRFGSTKLLEWCVFDPAHHYVLIL